MSVNASLDLPSNIALVHEWFTPRSTGGAENVVEVIDELLTDIASQPELFSLVNEENLSKSRWLVDRKLRTILVKATKPDQKVVIYDSNLKQWSINVIGPKEWLPKSLKKPQF